MTDKILEAVKALGGEWKSEKSKVAICMTRPGLNWSHAQFFDECYFAVPALYLSELWASVTQSEFNTYAEQWIKDAYMHNAAIDCNWDLYYRDGYKLVWTGDDIVAHFGVDICTGQEFIEYCEANKPIALAVAECAGNVVGKEFADALESIHNSNAEQQPVFTQAMADAGELPPVGCKVVVRNDENYAVSTYGEIFIDNEVTLVSTFINTTGVQMVAVSLDSGGCYCFRVDMIRPIKSPSDKAIDEMLETAISSEDDIAKSIIYEACAKLYDAGYRKLTQEQRKEFDL